MATKKASPRKTVETLTHGDATRKNIPTAEYQSVLEPRKRDPVAVRYPRGGAGLDEEKAARNTELDPQLVWRGKDRQDEGDLVVQAPPLYIREKVHANPYYLLADSPEGRAKEAEVGRTPPPPSRALPAAGSTRAGFVYERVPHITLKSIANNAEIDVIWDEWQATLEPLRERLNAASK